MNKFNIIILTKIRITKILTKIKIISNPLTNLKSKIHKIHKTHSHKTTTQKTKKKLKKKF